MDGLPYPGLVPGDDVAQGAVITDLTADEWTVLDAFENPQYDVVPVDIEDDGQAYAYAYAVAGDLAPLDSPWHRHRFETVELADCLKRCGDWRTRHEGSCGPREPT
jgi:gamma-glutamylcyclotransferase (GGCT)/AIG2-like uncharacterized protein YtfP